MYLLQNTPRWVFLSGRGTRTPALRAKILRQAPRRCTNSAIPIHQCRTISTRTVNSDKSHGVAERVMQHIGSNDQSIMNGRAALEVSQWSYYFNTRCMFMPAWIQIQVYRGITIVTLHTTIIDITIMITIQQHKHVCNVQATSTYVLYQCLRRAGLQLESDPRLHNMMKKLQDTEDCIDNATFLR